MKTSNEGLVELVGHEGVALSKYKDSVGVWTVGIGATVTEIPGIASWPLGRKITVQESFELLSKSIVKYENAVNKALTRNIPQYQFDALVSWCYNVGVDWPRKATVVKLINQDAPIKQLYSALMMFKKPPEIIGRRIKEAILLSTGKYSNNGRALLFPVSSSGYPMYGKGTLINVWQYINHTSTEQPIPPEVPKEEQKKQETRPSLLQQIIEYFWSKQ
jgi:lysozyme